MTGLNKIAEEVFQRFAQKTEGLYFNDRTRGLSFNSVRCLLSPISTGYFDYHDIQRGQKTVDEVVDYYVIAAREKYIIKEKNYVS